MVEGLLEGAPKGTLHAVQAGERLDDATVIHRVAEEICLVSKKHQDDHKSR